MYEFFDEPEPSCELKLKSACNRELQNQRWRIKKCGARKSPIDLPKPKRQSQRLTSTPTVIRSRKHPGAEKKYVAARESCATEIAITEIAANDPSCDRLRGKMPRLVPDHAYAIWYTGLREPSIIHTGSRILFANI